MIKISYQPTYTFTSLDVFDYADSEPITYEAHARQSAEWAALCQAWLKAGFEDVEQAIQIVGLAIVSVSQNGERYPISGIDGARALRDAVEAGNPGCGDAFIKHLALGHYNYHFRRADERLKNSREPSALSTDGNGRGK